MGQKSGSLRVLLVDDDLAFAQYMRLQLLGEGSTSLRARLRRGRSRYSQAPRSTKPPRVKREPLPLAGVRPDPLRLEDIQRVAQEAERLLKQKASTVVVTGERSLELTKPLQPYQGGDRERLIDYPYHKNVFLMMKCRSANPALENSSAIRYEAAGFVV